MKNKNINNPKGITLVALVITIVILLILAGISISALTNTGLYGKAKEAKQAQMEAEMQESLQLAIQELQIEKLGGATLDDITEEWLDEKMKDYESTLEDDPEIEGKEVILEKNGITGTFLIDENLKIIKIENKGSLRFKYEVGERDGETVKIIINFQDKENGIDKIEIPDKETVVGNGTKEPIEIEYEVQIGTEYKITVMLGNGELKEETILINEYYHKVTKNLAEGVKIDNTAVKATYNQPYQATITVEGDYAIDTLTVTMGGTPVTVDKTTGIINIEKVTGDIEIKANAIKLELQTTEPIIGTSKNSTSSNAANSITRGTTLYINFVSTLNVENGICTVEPQVPYSVTSNGTYKFTVTGTYENKTITKEIETKVDQYMVATDLVQYDAGDWTEEEIEVLKSKKLYDVNISHTVNDIWKAVDEQGLNFTFGGFTYKGDTINSASITSGEVITSRNQSATPGSGGMPNYDGWQIFEKKEENGKIYVTKLIHAGSPENFVFNAQYYGDLAEYILSGGERMVSTGEYYEKSHGISARNFDMYKDKNQLDLISEVHCLTYEECEKLSKTGANYWLATHSDNTTIIGNHTYGYRHLWSVKTNGSIINSIYSGCLGIRPVVTMKDGVYIVSGDGTGTSPYVLGME